MQPLLDNPSPVRAYAPGTWGPFDADDLVADCGGWRDPWL
jgi:glucose-6-phosphate 1-dehydrogenase